MEKCDKMAALFISSLKTIYTIHQRNHWITQGSNFYGDHLLFQRLYESVQEDLDLAAEKFVGLFGSHVLEYNLYSDLCFKLMKKYNSINDPVEQSLKIEKDFIQLCKTAYDCFEEEGKLSLGLDDMIMSISSNREEAVYLLSQTLKNN